jgi:hypothetical protein
MVGELARFTAHRGDHVNIDIVVVIRAESDHRPVRRKNRAGRKIAPSDKTMRLAALPARNPNIASVDESICVLLSVGVWISTSLLESPGEK